MAYINPSPGVATQEVTLMLGHATGNVYTGNLAVPGLQDITVNNANDVFTWTQLDETAKKQVATTSTNSLSMNLVVDEDVFFGNVAAWGNGTVNAATVSDLGVMGLSVNKVRIDFSIRFAPDSDGASAETGRYISGVGYITGLAPTVSADAPVWVTPITITVDGEYLVSTTAPDITK